MDNKHNKTKQNISIIGDGSMATVLALLLESSGHNVTLWGHNPKHVHNFIQTRENKKYLPGYRIPDTIRLTAENHKIFNNANIILSAVPTQFIRTIWTKLAKHVPHQTPIVSVSKGIENTTSLRPTQIIAQVLNQNTDDPDKASRPLATLSGPSIAHELAKCLPATVCAASDDLQFAKILQNTFTTDWFRVYTNTDLLGVELAGATKNVIALAAGILDGLQAGNNAKSALLSRGLAEITRLGTAMGAARDTFFGIAGIGDLATTCFSPTGRNRSCGELLGKGKSLEQVLQTIQGVVEGVPTTKSVVQLAKKYRVEMPITQAVFQVLFQNLDPLQGISQLMTRQTKHEIIG